MIQEHSANLQELEKLAQKKGVALPKTPNKDQQARAKQLEGLSGAAFDQRYMREAGLADHKNAVQRFKKGTGSNDPEVKAYAEKTLPHVEQHLKMAEQTAPTK
jgi:putative membrane protein